MEFLKEADLAVESYTRDQKKEQRNGIITTTLIVEGQEIIKTEIINEVGSEKTGKEIGTYLTVLTGNAHKYTESEKSKISNAITILISELLGEIKPVPTRFLVVGLGNEEILSDSLGACVVNQLTPSAHLRKNKRLYSSIGYDLTTLKPGVLGQSGISALSQIKGVLPLTEAEVVFCIDSLITFDKSRLLKTVQISNTGIMPGSGKGQGTKKIAKEALGVQVFSIGVPTTIKPSPKSGELYTYFDIDLYLNELSKIISNGILGAIKRFFSNT